MFLWFIHPCQSRPARGWSNLGHAKLVNPNYLVSVGPPGALPPQPKPLEASLCCFTCSFDGCEQALAPGSHVPHQFGGGYCHNWPPLGRQLCSSCNVVPQQLVQHGPGVLAWFAVTAFLCLCILSTCFGIFLISYIHALNCWIWEWYIQFRVKPSVGLG